MTSIKKTLPLILAFGLGALITYLAVHLNIANKKLEEKTMHPQKSIPKKEEKTWFDEEVEQLSAESEKRNKEQQSKGDELKSQFDQFSNE